MGLAGGDMMLPDFGGNTQNTREMLGGFWSKIPTESDGTTDRTAVDQARMQLLQQLLAAILNVGAFGTTTYDNLIQDGIDVYEDTDATVTDILAIASDISAITEAGSGEMFPGGIQDSAQPKLAKDIADVMFWDIIP